MAHYIPDFKYEEAMRVVESLDPNNERDALLKYYIEKNRRWYQEQSDLLKEYQDIFEKIDRFLPNRNPILGS